MPLGTLKLQSDIIPTTLISTTTEDKVSLRSTPLFGHSGADSAGVYFIMQEFAKAITDYTKSTELDGAFIFTHVQHAVAQYKQGSVASSMAAFRRILKQFPDRGEPSNY